MYAKQKGAVLLEAAYVLPIMLTAILLTIEAVDYAVNSFSVNDVLYDTRLNLVNDVSAVSNSGGTSGYASCPSGSVVLDEALIKSDVTTKAVDRIKLSSTNSGLTVTGSTSVVKNPVAGFDVYVITFTGTAPTLILPNFLSGLLPIKVDTILSVKDSCPPPP